MSAYATWSVWERRSGGVLTFVRLSLRQLPVFGLFVLAGGATHFWVNWVKFETIEGRYLPVGFGNPFPTALHGFLFSPGHSVFIYTPLLLLLPWMLPHLARTRRREAALILALTSSYLLFYASFEYWHGLYFLGPRYLMPVVPFLLLPLAGWLDATRAIA